MKQQPNKVICAIFWAFFEHIVFYEDHVSTCGWQGHWLAKCSKGISRPFLCQPRFGMSGHGTFRTAPISQLFLRRSLHISTSKSPSNPQFSSISWSTLAGKPHLIWLHHAPSLYPSATLCRESPHHDGRASWARCNGSRFFEHHI